LSKTPQAIVEAILERGGLELPGDLPQALYDRIDTIIASFADRPASAETLLLMLAALALDPELGAAHTPWCWLTFYDPDQTGPYRFQGVILIRALSVEIAIITAFLRGIAPDGVAEGVILPAHFCPNENDRDRLLGPDEAERVRRSVYGALH